MKKLNVLVYDYISEEILNFLKESFEVTVFRYKEDSITGRDVDLVLFADEQTGDLLPDYYSEVIGSKTTIIDKYWDKFTSLRDFSMYRDIPKLGIGNGAQFLTILAGGSLIQHVTGHDETHEVYVSDGFGSRINITDNHHQMMYPYEIPVDKFKIIAHTRYFRSETYLNGKNKEIELEKDFVEPEIVYYNNLSGGGLAIQANPAKDKDSFRSIGASLIKQLIDGKL